MDIKAPTPQVPPPVWTEFKDLQEWEKYRQERPEGDKHSALFESVTEGLVNFPGGFVVTTLVDAFLNWARKSSVWPVPFGLACCAIEMMGTFASRFDVERLGMVPWASPRYSDLMTTHWSLMVDPRRTKIEGTAQATAKDSVSLTKQKSAKQQHHRHERRESLGARGA